MMWHLKINLNIPILHFLLQLNHPLTSDYTHLFSVPTVLSLLSVSLRPCTKHCIISSPVPTPLIWIQCAPSSSWWGCQYCLTQQISLRMDPAETDLWGRDCSANISPE